MDPTCFLSANCTINSSLFNYSSFLTIHTKAQRERIASTMVGLSVVLEGKRSSTTSSCSGTSSKVLNKANIIMNTSSTSPTPSSASPSPVSKRAFLDHCFLCKQKLFPGKDIYMYKGDKGFCSEECRWRQMDMDEEETKKPKTKKRQ